MDLYLCELIVHIYTYDMLCSLPPAYPQRHCILIAGPRESEDFKFLRDLQCICHAGLMTTCRKVLESGSVNLLSSNNTGIKEICTIKHDMSMLNGHVIVICLWTINSQRQVLLYRTLNLVIKVYHVYMSSISKYKIFSQMCSIAT